MNDISHLSHIVASGFYTCDSICTGNIKLTNFIFSYEISKVFTCQCVSLEQYYKTDEERIATRVGNKTQAAPYWLRSEAGGPDFAAKLQAYFDGKYYKIRICAESVDTYGAISDNRLATEECGVRIAVWVDLSKI